MVKLSIVIAPHGAAAQKLTQPVYASQQLISLINLPQLAGVSQQAVKFFLITRSGHEDCWDELNPSRTPEQLHLTDGALIGIRF